MEDKWRLHVLIQKLFFKKARHGAGFNLLNGNLDESLMMAWIHLTLGNNRVLNRDVDLFINRR